MPRRPPRGTPSLALTEEFSTVYFEEFSIGLDTKGKVTTLAYNNPRINGDNSGPFIRQTSVKGYIGSRTQFTLPSKTGGFNIPTAGATGYIYNGLDYNIETGSNSFSMEGGVQASQANNNFLAYIRVNGRSLVFTDDGNNPGNYPPRYKAGTAYTSNLRYEVSTGKAKYYASGTNVNGVAQNLSFTYSKSFTSTELANMRAKRVLGIGYVDPATGTQNYDGTQDLGVISLNYTSATLLKTDGTTTVNYNTSLLDTDLYNNKIYGTAYWPSSAVTYSPTLGTFLHRANEWIQRPEGLGATCLDDYKSIHV
ncbi:hypothetical protein [Cohnella sp.]|uniref:hypothetical protein n=1 Tax=Cohnella sp. TaxID=1883426 RepID=UPI002580A5B7|nr:hypothetical protein [Cohnella sp.]